MKYLNILITLPITVFAIFFASVNTDSITISLNPVYDEFEMPIYLLALGMLGIGFLSGALFVSMNEYKTKVKLRKERKRANLLEKELEKNKNSKEALNKKTPNQLNNNSSDIKLIN